MNGFLIKLKPCPVCGERAKLHRLIIGYTHPYPSFTVACDNEDCELEPKWFDTKNQAITYWEQGRND